MPHLSGLLAEKPTVLVVDDEDAIRKVCSLILSKNGFDVLTAVNGEAALEVLSTDHDQIDVVLLDLTMPGMSGSDVLAVIVATYPGIPVILCSGYLASVTETMGENCSKLPKPFSAEQLVSSINKSLRLDKVKLAL